MFMKRMLFTFAVLFGVVLPGYTTTIAFWGFEPPNVPPTVVGPTITGLVPHFGSGVASGFHASPLTTFSSGIGNGSAHSLTANYCQIGDYYQFQVSTIGFSGLQFSLDQTGSYGGVTNATFAYSLDGISFTTVNNNVVLQPGVTWNSTTRNTACITSFDLSNLTQLDNQPDVYLRLSANLPPFANANGTWTIDNVSVSGIQVPEPGSLVLSGPVLVLLLRRRKTDRT
jgi:hypothetical protein